MEAGEERQCSLQTSKIRLGTHGLADRASFFMNSKPFHLLRQHPHVSFSKLDGGIFRQMRPIRTGKMLQFSGIWKNKRAFAESARVKYRRGEGCVAKEAVSSDERAVTGRGSCTFGRHSRSWRLLLTPDAHFKIQRVAEHLARILECCQAKSYRT